MNSGPNPTTFLILAAAALVAGGSAIYYQSTQLSDAESSISALKKKLRDEKQTALEVTTTGDKVAESQQRLDHLEQGVPELAYIPTMLTELENVGRKDGIIVLGVRPIQKPADKSKDGKPKKQSYEELNIEVKGRGDYQAVSRFLSSLRAFPKIVAVRTLTLSPKTSEMEKDRFASPMLDATVEIRAFLFPETPPKQVASGSESKTMDRRGVADQMVEPPKN
ncbi:MAG: type 4a pilus biogenesis protein PilO [Fimbriimonadaceae bacterium]|nr:type 4a pilus biogenesis protein PilO [Fimbriimonadaceae bacterium]